MNKCYLQTFVSSCVIDQTRQTLKLILHQKKFFKFIFYSQDFVSGLTAGDDKNIVRQGHTLLNVYLSFYNEPKDASMATMKQIYLQNLYKLF